MAWMPLLVLIASALPALAWAATVVPPGADEGVVEVLPSITRQRPVAPSGAVKVDADPLQAARSAREAIAMARQTGDTRYWG